MRKHHYFAIAAAAGVAVFFLMDGWIAGVGGAIGLICLFFWLREEEGFRNGRVLYSTAFTDYDQIVGGVIWRVADAEVVASNRLPSAESGHAVTVEHLCKTKNGSWFLFYVTAARGQLIDRYVRPTNEQGARYLLEKSKNLYAKHFGQPAQA